MNRPVYLDYAAATPLDPRVLEAMMPYFTKDFYNPSAIYQPAEEVKRALNQARQSVAIALGARASEIVFTAGGTEANNLAIAGVMDNFKQANLIVSGLEHESIRQPASCFKFKDLPVKKDGLVDLKKLINLIDDQTVLISINYANNEIGVIEPIGQVGQLVAKERQERLKDANKLPLYLHTDAAQAANYLDLHVSRLKVDLMSLNGGKIYGPKGSGALYVKAGTRLRPLIKGGGQERGLRSGTENVPSAIGFSKALETAQANRLEESVRLKELQAYFIKGLKERLPKSSLNGSLKQRLVNNIHVTFPKENNERLLIGLDEAGILAAAGSACSASSDNPSHVLTAIGLTDEQARASLRFSLGRMTTKAELDFTLARLVNIIKP